MGPLWGPLLFPKNSFISLQKLDFHLKLLWLKVSLEFVPLISGSWGDSIRTSLNLLVPRSAGLLLQAFPAWGEGIPFPPNGDVTRMWDREKIQEPSQPWWLLSVPQLWQGQAQFFYFPIDIASLQSFYWAIPAIKKKKKKDGGGYLNLPDWTKRNSLWFKWWDFSYVLAEGPAGRVLGDASMTLRHFGVSWVSLKVLLDPPGNSPWFYSSPDDGCHEICPSPVTLWQPLSCHLIDVYTAINTLLFISALRTSPWFVGSLVFVKCFGKSGGQSGVISGFVWKRNTLKGRLFIYFILFLGEDAEGRVNYSSRSCQERN